MASAILSPAVENTTDSKIAVPSVPPICRKNVTEEVVTPMSRAGIAFCTASTRVCMHRPRPRPSRAMVRSSCQIGIDGVTVCHSSTIATVMNAVPITGKIL